MKKVLAIRCPYLSMLSSSSVLQLSYMDCWYLFEQKFSLLKINFNQIHYHLWPFVIFWIAGLLKNSAKWFSVELRSTNFLLSRGFYTYPKNDNKMIQGLRCIDASQPILLSHQRCVWPWIVIWNISAFLLANSGFSLYKRPSCAQYRTQFMVSSCCSSFYWTIPVQYHQKLNVTLFAGNSFFEIVCGELPGFDHDRFRLIFSYFTYFCKPIIHV